MNATAMYRLQPNVSSTVTYRSQSLTSDVPISSQLYHLSHQQDSIVSSSSLSSSSFRSFGGVTDMNVTGMNSSSAVTPRGHSSSPRRVFSDSHQQTQQTYLSLPPSIFEKMNSHHIYNQAMDWSTARPLSILYGSGSNISDESDDHRLQHIIIHPPSPSSTTSGSHDTSVSLSVSIPSDVDYCDGSRPLITATSHITDASEADFFGDRSGNLFSCYRGAARAGCSNVLRRRKGYERNRADDDITKRHAGDDVIVRKERRRTIGINSAFTALRCCIPNVASDTKLSKIKTLRLATSYIAYLTDMLSRDDEKIQQFGEFTAIVTKRLPESREDIRKREEEILKASRSNYSSSDKQWNNKGRTGWPQQVWAAELKP